MPSSLGPSSPYRVALVFPADPERRQKTSLENSRFARTAAALAEKGIAVEGAPYLADAVEDLRSQLLRVDGVLVWINPIVDGRDRTELNRLLAEVAAAGIFVSAHPDVIAKMGTKGSCFAHDAWDGVATRVIIPRSRRCTGTCRRAWQRAGRAS